ncbi:C1 family peptidase [Bacillus atrophaeus]|uniref:C1 family peptidase n=1 Tax=Bacillus atrophaeus TaxID=1452 RepID=UPI00227FCC52|nr:C1 family peptidase [Bacillus atrophaeus]MCY8499344.1 C1 family peptidase [Bacillus atrophaeus]MCY8815080.1 C1 family peptidase [Bacillus atrophaeus]MCY8823239.1 C1 family peptidase [Bacillus atrophaeus]MCY8830242.1 C1 family peptidase [Bacillus atrophaeus]MCY8835308.1 C1 family peptidase [Bacillus atrophaeus]
MSEIKGLGFIPSPEDRRDILMSAILPVFSAPRKVDYTDQMTAVRDQGAEGTCVGFACAVGLKEYQEKKEHTNNIDLSPRFLYQKCKERDGIPDQEGTYIKIALGVLKEVGVCEETYWPYVANNTGSPKPGAEENASRYKIKAYARLDSLETMKRSLVVNGPCVAGVPVYQNWSTQEVWTSGKIPMPGNSPLEGGHAICIVGYDDDTEMFKFKNSWDTVWGDNGYGYLPYEYIELADSEAWSATDLIGDPASLVRAKEKALERLEMDYKGKTKDFKGSDQTIEYH